MYKVMITFYRGHISSRGLPFGSIICDIWHPPWEIPLIGIPYQTLEVDSENRVIYDDRNSVLIMDLQDPSQEVQNGN